MGTHAIFLIKTPLNERVFIQLLLTIFLNYFYIYSVNGLCICVFDQKSCYFDSFSQNSELLRVSTLSNPTPSSQIVLLTRVNILKESQTQSLVQLLAINDSREDESCKIIS